MFHVYILLSSSLNKYYLGSTQHLDIRLEEHNRGKSPFTKTGIPWTIIHTISCASRTEAVQLENQIKKRGITRYLDDNGVSHCLNPLINWTKFENQFCYTKLGYYEQNQKKIQPGRPAIYFEGMRA